MANDAHSIAETIFSECLGLRSRLLSRVISRRFDAALRPLGIKGPQMTILVALEITQPTRPSELGDLLDVEKSTLSRTLQRMREAGWIRLEDAPDDGRGQTVTITAAGRRMLKQVLPVWRTVQDELAGEMGTAAKGQLERLYRRASSSS